MISVFASFILNGDPTVKQFGVGLSVGVALAALMVLLLAPALLVWPARAAGGCRSGWTATCRTSTSRAPACRRTRREAVQGPASARPTTR